MKKLQNNFTTPEQSERLLKLGVPADSADCYYNIYVNTPYVFIPNMMFSKYKVVENITPYWSVGRLIEIISICSTAPFPNEIIITRKNVDLSIIEALIERFEELTNYYSLDFSKLEE